MDEWFATQLSKHWNLKALTRNKKETMCWCGWVTFIYAWLNQLVSERILTIMSQHPRWLDWQIHILTYLDFNPSANAARNNMPRKISLTYIILVMDHLITPQGANKPRSTSSEQQWKQKPCQEHTPALGCPDEPRRSETSCLSYMSYPTACSNTVLYIFQHT